MNIREISPPKELELSYMADIDAYQQDSPKIGSWEKSSSLAVGSTAGGLDAVRAKQPAPPLQGSFLALRQFPGLAPWAFLLDPFRVPIGLLI
jgi:hypothetical protein